MAAPQTHGFFCFIMIASLNVIFKLTKFDFFSAIFFGVGIDFLDHFTSISYTKDLVSRIKQGRGTPAKGVILPVCWLHLWPGFLISLTWGYFSFFMFKFSSWFFLPLAMWSVHVAVDMWQKNTKDFPYYAFFYPFDKRKIICEIGYPCKHPSEFVIDSSLWMLISFFLLLKVIFT